MDPILEILEKDARITPEEIAKMLKKSISEVKKTLQKFEKEKVILHYKAVIKKELLRNSSEVRALIEVKITPQRDVGFDGLAERIYKFPEVKSCYLMSGGYDLLVTVEGKDLQTRCIFTKKINIKSPDSPFGYVSDNERGVYIDITVFIVYLCQCSVYFRSNPKFLMIQWSS